MAITFLEKRRECLVWKKATRNWSSLAKRGTKLPLLDSTTIHHLYFRSIKPPSNTIFTPFLEKDCRCSLPTVRSNDKLLQVFIFLCNHNEICGRKISSLQPQPPYFLAQLTT